MKQFSLSKICLLAVSGELGADAWERLRKHLSTHPAARLEYEQLRRRFDQLQSLPRLPEELDPVSRARIAASIKRGIHKALEQQRHMERRRKMMRAVYRCLSVASGVAACLIIAAGVYLVRLREQIQEQNILDAESTFQEVAQSNLPGTNNSPLGLLARRIERMEKSRGLAAESGLGDANWMNLLNALDKVNLDETAPAPSDAGY